MPIHLIWGDDLAASDRKIEALIQDYVDPSWYSINLSRLDGIENTQLVQALGEMRTPPFGTGDRVVLIKRSPFLNGCSSNLAQSFVEAIELIPNNTHLILNNYSKPDSRLKTTKLIKKLVKSKKASESSFVLPAIWDGAGQFSLIEQAAIEMNLELDNEAKELLVQAIGNDSYKLRLELQKVALYAETNRNTNTVSKKPLLIKAKNIKGLIEGLATNSLQIGDSLLNNNFGEAIIRLEALLDTGEPPLKILATLTRQVRGWLWVTLLDQNGETDIGIIAKAAGIGNPKRIYIMRKQLKGKSSIQFLKLLTALLDIEAALKKGEPPKNAFKDNLIFLPN